MDICPEENMDKEIDDTTQWNMKINEVFEGIKAFKDGCFTQLVIDGAGKAETTTPLPIRALGGISQFIFKGAGEQVKTNFPISNQGGGFPESNSGGLRHPKLNLPRFSGDITQFTSFWQSFEYSVHGNDTISQVNKLNYLMNLLDGPGQPALAGLELTAGNYNNALETLHSRFGNKQQIITSHMQAWLKLQSSPNDKVSQLRCIYDNINVHV